MTRDAPPVSVSPHHDSTAEPPLAHYDPGDRWVPVDRRWLGLDRATIAPALVVLALVLVMAAALPAIDSAVDYDDRVVAGDVMEVASGVTFEPAVGWGITSGVRAGAPVSGSFPRVARLEDGDTSFTLRTGTFSGDAEALLAQIKDTTEALDESVHVDGTPTAISTTAGVPGVISRYEGPRFAGLLAAFVEDGVGVQVVAIAPPDGGQQHDRAADVAGMITSIRFSGEER